MDFSIKDYTILLTLAGSRAYGMDTSASDVDIKGVCYAPARYYLSTQKFEQFDKKDGMQVFLHELPERLRGPALQNGMEGTVFEIRRFLDLASGANPNILDVLFCREQDVILQTPEGALLRENRNVFLTKKCMQTFMGYARQQADRIETHRKYLLNPPSHEPTRAEFGLPERNGFPQDQVNAAMALIRKQIDRWNIDFVDVDEATKIFVQDQISHHLAEIQIGTSEKWQAAGNLLGYDTNFMQFVHQQRLYDQSVREWSSYQTWKRERNKLRAGMESEIGYDAKNGAHLARLVIACRTIFETGTLSVYNPNEWVRDIRACKVPYEALKEWVTEQQDDLAQLAAKSKLPARVEQAWLDSFAVELLSRLLGVSK